VVEFYLVLCYEERYGLCALALDETIISINSFSKYFSMTGWRLGWLVLPPPLVPVVERLRQLLT
ncbi:MAG: aminotransferase class I/II-fold pyridoxal phosphate-dependent enzyme, partial [bacterium]